MKEYLGEIEGWMEQVRDEETSVEDYNFIDKLAHGGSINNGNNGLANVAAYLTIWEDDGELYVDEELVDALDEQQAEEHSGGKRFRNIVYDAVTSKREDNTLYDRGVDGHEFLQNMIDEFRKEANISSPDDNKFKVNDSNMPTLPDGKGDTMTEYTERFDELNQAVEEGEVENLEEYMNQATNLLDEAEEDYGEAKPEHFYKLTEGVGYLLGFEGRELLDASQSLVEDSESVDAMAESGANANEALRKDYEVFVDTVAEKLDRWGETYKAHMQDVASGMAATGERMENANSNLEEVSDNLEEATKTLRGISGASPDKSAFEDGVSELESLRKESGMEFDEGFLEDTEE